MKLVLRKKKPESDSYKYILDENRITVRRFSDRTEALTFLKSYDPNYKLSDWECITFKKFKEELEIHGTLV